jgi:DNA-binding PadR family transcriptional regulator
MDNKIKLLEEKEKIRHEILGEFYTKTNGDTTIRLDLSIYFKDAILSPEEAAEKNAIIYLSEEGLIELMDQNPSYSITPKGVKEFEQSIQHPEAATEHFSSPVIQQIFNAPVGTVQTGNNNNAYAYVSQVNNIGIELQDAIEDLKSLVDSLSENHQNDASEVIEDLQEEIANPTKQSRLKSSLINLWQFGKESVDFANKVSAIAQRFGIDLSNF